MRSVFIERPAAAVARRRAAGWQGGLRVWLPVVFALIVIALESTKTMSAAHTSSWLRPIFERYLGHINDRVWGAAHHVMRKAGHFCGYGMVCVTLLRAWLLTLAQRTAMNVQRWWWQSVGLAVGCTIAVASLDEWHQTFLPGRTGQVSDVLIDTMGGVVAVALVGAAGALMRRRVRRAELVAV